MDWVEFVAGAEKPPEQKDLLIRFTSGNTVFGRNLEGAVCLYNPETDRFVEYTEDWERWVSHYCVVTGPGS